MNLARQPDFFIIFQSPARLAVSNALVRSTKVIVETRILFLVFLLKLPCCEDLVNDPVSFLDPHWLSSRSPDFSMCSFNRFSRTLARIFPAIDNKKTPLFPFSVK